MRNIFRKSKKPIENQKTAAWSNIEESKPVSNVAEPNNIQAVNAKEYVDENEK
ncbi:MAG: DUF3787 domain-containing protein [Bacillota bacterium]|nr:DUF3787 domain-containing protein [Bacillota bacterium]